MASIRIKFHRRVRQNVRVMIRRIVRGFEAVSVVRKSFDLKVLPHHHFISDEIGDCFGIFSYAPKFAVIGVTSGCLMKSRAHRLYQIADVTLHELAHYEQWRDGRTVQERGVKVRARSLAKLIREWESKAH